MLIAPSHLCRFLVLAIAALTSAPRDSVNAANAVPVPTTHATSADWPEFRGPTGQGHATTTQLPLEWSPGKNVVWKTPLPGVGWSSPAISRGQIFLTTAVAGSENRPSLQVICLDSNNGAELWTKEVFTSAETQAQPIHQKNSQASPSPIVEGDFIFAHFGHHGTACLDRSGKIIWRQQSLSYEAVHGNGSAPIIVEDKLIFSADGSKDPLVAALDKKTGEIRWKFNRAMEVKQKFSFCTPLLITVDGRAQIISPGSGAISALDPLDGHEIWRVRYGAGYSVIPRPVFAHGLLFIATGYNRADLLAIRVDGLGDVTDTHIVWRTTKGAPLTPSVIVVGDELYAVNDAGIATCWDARTGTLHWQEKIEGNYSASPLAAAGRIYFQSETGVGSVIAASRTFAKLATNALEERTLASYAVCENALIIRTEHNLYRFAENSPPARR